MGLEKMGGIWRWRTIGEIWCVALKGVSGERGPRERERELVYLESWRRALSAR